MEKEEVIPSTSIQAPPLEQVVNLENGVNSNSSNSFTSLASRLVRRIRERLLRTQLVEPKEEETNSHLETSTVEKFTNIQKKTLASLVLVNFVIYYSVSIMGPFFPRVASEKGLSDTMTGFVFSFSALIVFITSPIYGKLLPKIGAKRQFLSGMFVVGVCYLLFGMLEFVTDYTLFVSLCFLIRGFEALGTSAFSNACYVFAVYSFPNNIGTVLGVIETFSGIGMTIGPAVGGFLYSLGGFGLPFVVSGVTMILIIPINIWLLPSAIDMNVQNTKTSMMELMKIPAVLVIGLIVIVGSSTWAFLDPTLEPHLRQFNLSPEKTGLIFLLLSGLYGLSSPAWGWLADKVNSHWPMTICGLFVIAFGLILLGPSPYFTFLESSLWLNLVALSILGVSIALALIPTFQSVLTTAIDAGCPDSLSTSSLVAGVWAGMYSLGEILGPSLGGFLSETYGFPIAATIMAILTSSMGLLGLIFFACRPKVTRAADRSSTSSAI